MVDPWDEEPTDRELDRIPFPLTERFVEGLEPSPNPVALRIISWEPSAFTSNVMFPVPVLNEAWTSERGKAKRQLKKRRCEMRFFEHGLYKLITNEF